MSSLTSKNGPRQRVVNIRAALILAVVVGAAVFGMRRLHDRQMSRTLEFLRNNAFQSAETEDYSAAQLHLSQYLVMNPGDTEAREKLSELLTDHIGTTQALDQAFRLNEDLLRKGVTNDGLRLRQAGIAIKLRRHADAEAHLKVLRTSRSDDAEVWYLSAVAANAARDSDKTVQFLKRSLRCTTRIPEAYALLAAQAIDSTPAEYQAKALMEQMIAECHTGKAHQIRADYFTETGRYSEAIDDLWKALEESPNDMALNARLVRCIHAKNTAESDETVAIDPATATVQRAIRHFESRIAETSQNPLLRLYLATILWKIDDRPRAIDELEKGIQVSPRAFELHELLIEYLVSENQAAKARRIIESIPTGGFSRDVYQYCLGRILMAERQWKAAAAALEQALAFGQKNSGLFSRAQMSYAVCRSRSGEPEAALDAFRNVVAASPGSKAARLGIAAAWVHAGQLDLAIAEYRQLQAVAGVSACLADLLIQKNLQQTPSLRSWDEIDTLIREDNPKIPDPVERLLLRGDRLFAAGQIIAAIRTLEHAKVVYPNRREVVSASERLRTEFAAGLHERLTQLANEDPANPEVRAALLRQTLSSSGIAEALAEVGKLIETNAETSKNREDVLLLALRTLDHAVSLEQQIRRVEFVKPLQQAAVTYAMQLADRNPAYERELVRTLIRSGRSDEAMRILSTEPEKGSPEMRAVALLESVRSASRRDAVLPDAIRALFALVARHPDNVELRLYYAELMLYARQYAMAEQTLAPLRSAAEHDGRINAMRAWLRAAEQTDLDEASQLISAALKSNPQETVFREVQARVWLTHNEPEKALKILEAIPADRFTSAGRVYLAAILLKLDREQEAHAAFAQIQAFNHDDELLPADEDLLKSVTDLILPPATAFR